MGADDQVAKRVRMHQCEPYEHARIADVVLLQVVGAGIFLDEGISIGEIHHDDQRVRLGRLVRRHAGEHPPANLERRLAP